MMKDIVSYKEILVYEYEYVVLVPTLQVREHVHHQLATGLLFVTITLGLPIPKVLSIVYRTIL